jgi:NitT/TauT family transport system permease protein
VQIWAALFAAAALSAALVGLIGVAGRIAQKRMAFVP